MLQKRLVTGLQSSGQLHLGSYLGTIRQWQQFTKTHECFFFVADLHAITVKQDPKSFLAHNLNTAMSLLACGVDPTTQGLFLQSQVPGHAELGWLFSCLTPLGELNRMTQFKEKSSTQKQKFSLGLLAYPCLMAADILLYNPSHVPVGADQKQHLELTRNIAQRFNRDYGETFVIPEPYISGPGARVMALQAPSKKMSKSDQQVSNTLFLLDSDDAITKKIKRAVTDSENHVAADPNRPGIYNLVNIYAHLTDQTPDQITSLYQNKGYAPFKSDLADIVIQTLSPIRERFNEYAADKQGVIKILRDGADKANQASASLLYSIKQKLGFL